MKKRVLSLFLALTLCLTLLPTSAFAEGENSGIGSSATTTVEGGQPTATGAPAEGGGQLTNTGEGEQPNSETDTQTEIWCTRKPSSIQRGYDGTTDGSTIPIDLTFTDGTDTFTLKERTGFTAKKTFDSADAGRRTVTVEIELIGDAAAKYKLKAGEETFTIGGYIDKAHPDLTVSLSRATCAVGEKLLPLLSVEGAPEDAAVTYYYTTAAFKNLAGSSDVQGSEFMPKIDENTAIDKLDEEGNNTYYVYTRTAATQNYQEGMSNVLEFTVAEKVDPVASVTTDGTETTYGSFPDAWTAAIAKNGSTLKLLADATLPNGNTDLGQSLTLDLNGYVLGSNGSLTVKSGAALTVKNAGAEKSEKPVKAGLCLNLLVEKGGSFTCTDGVLQYLGLLSAGTGDYAIQLAEGENHCTFGGFAQGDESATVGDLLKAAPGMALHGDNSGSDVQITRSTLISKGFNYFSFYVGSCSEHQIGEDGTCDYCGASYVASVTTGGETVSYTSLDAALNAAQDGDTVTLLSDVDLGETYVTIDKSITFDLGSKTLSSSKTWSSDGVLLVKDAAVTVKNGTVNATGIGNCAIRAYRSGASMTLEAVTATVTSDKSSVMVGDFGSAVIKSGDYQGLYVDKNSHVTLEGGTFRPYMDNITNKNVKSIFWKVNETTDATSRDCMELLGDGCVYVDENRKQVRTGGGFNTVVTVQKGTPIDTPVAKIGDVGYTSLSKAINAVQNGGIITLLDDLDLGNGAVLQVGSPKKNFTIDLDSHTLSADGACLIMLHNGSQLTLKNGTLDGSRCTSYQGVLFISSNSGPKLTLENVTAKSGTVADTLKDQRSVLLAYVTYGTVEFDGGTYTGGVLLKTDGNAVLKSGTFQKGNNSYSIKTEDSGKQLSNYLDGESLFWKDNAPLDLSSATQTADEVTVRPCEHNWENGKCTVCQKVCDHGSADGKSMTAAVCPTCGMKAAAQVDITGSDAKYFLTSDKALVYAFKNDGCTLKLLADVTEAAVMINNPFLFDLNGHNVGALSVDARATIKDSGTTKGRIGKVTVSDTKVPGLTLGGLLEEGYAFKYGNGYWANDSYLQTTEGSFVTVEKAPIQSVAVYAKDKNNKEVSTIAYGTTGDVTLVASCKLSETSGEKLSCAWYKLTDDTAIPPLDGATGTSYTLPADLPAGKHTYWVTFTSDGYSKSAEITVTVTPISLAGAEVTVQNPTYNGKLQEPKVTVKLGDKTLSRDNDYTMEVTKQTDAGSYKLTIKGGGNYTDEIKDVEWKIEPMKIDSVMVSPDISKVYDGTATVTKTAEEWAKILTFKTLSAYAVVDVPSGAYTISDAYFVEKSGEETIHSPDAGEKYGITFKITLNDDNYVLQTYGEDTPSTSKVITQSGGANFTIEQANVTSPGEITQLVFNDLAKTYTIDLPALPALDGEKTYGDTQYAVDQSSVKELTQGYNAIQDVGFAVNPDNGKTQLTFHAPAVKNQTEGSVGAIKITVTPTNYEPVTLTVKLQSVNKRKPGMFVSVATDPIVYGMTLGDIKLSADATVDNQVIPGTITWEDPLTTVPAAGQATYRWTFTPDDTMHYLTASNTITFSVDKATPTGAPTYTAIITGGKTLADAALTANAGWPSGTVQWVDKDGKPLPASTQVQANTEYTWSFTPADAANYNGATGSVTLYAVTSGGGSSSGGGGSSSSTTTKTDTATNPDGSTTKTETKSDGTVVETTTGKDGIVSKTTTNPNGSSVTETKAADGSTGTVKTDKHGQTTAETTLSSKAIEDAKRNGEPVKAPVEVKASRNSNTAPTVKVELPKGTGETKVEIPVFNVKPGTVAVLVQPDGTEEIVKNSLPTEDGIQLTVNGGATVKIVDNSKDFIDTRSHWAKDAIGFVSARGLVNGMSATIYAPNASTTRAQLWTILARQNNADLTGGATWFENAQNWAKEKGISDGTNPNGTINRAQMVTMLWRAMDQPAAASGASFADVSADSYYAQAVAWAVENGITTGVGGGRFDPTATCTRGQIATFLYRLYPSR